MITIYLIRHGETLWNKKGRYQGIADVELSEKGILQADKIEDYFRDIKLDAVISSPLKRAVRTGQGVAGSHDLRLKHSNFLMVNLSRNAESVLPHV